MYDIIKKQNGENFARAIRNYDNGILDIPGIDKIVKNAGRDAGPIMQYLVSLKGIKIKEQTEYHDPIKLLDSAGYNAYVADTLEKQNAIKCFFAPGEELCTFDDANRFNKYHILNAVHKDIDNIKRVDYKKPQREDRYGTSVMSIQLLKAGGHVSIKNRYNHSVRNPDNTYGSNPDNIIYGLSYSLKEYFGVDFSSQGAYLPENYVLVGNQICKYETKIRNVYCAEEFYVKNDRIFPINKNYEKMLENGILLNLKDKKVSDIVNGGSGSFAATAGMRQGFVASLNKAVSGKKLRISKSKLGGYDIIVNGRQILTVNKCHIVNINIPDAEVIDLSNHEEFRGIFNLKNVKKLALVNCDLSGVEQLIMPTAAKVLTLSSVQLPECDLDLSSVAEMMITKADLSRVKTIILPRNKDFISFTKVVFPACDLDFSGIKKINLSDCDLSKVRSIKWPLHYLSEHNMIKLCDSNAQQQISNRIKHNCIYRQR